MEVQKPKGQLGMYVLHKGKTRAIATGDVHGSH